VKTVLFRTGGAATPANAGKGFLFDNVSLKSGATPTLAPVKANVCHLEGKKKGTFHLINVSENAVPAHLAHGDGLPGETVPGVEEKKFTEDCSIVDKWSLLETVEVPSDLDTDTLSVNPLLLGTNYMLKAYGTADAGDNIEFDARYSFRDPSSTEWTDAVSTYEGYGVTLLDLFFNGTTPWGDFVPGHEYEYVVAGDGNNAAFKVYDVFYPNNVGSLFVDIYEEN
jgi:hypothetical protein